MTTYRIVGGQPLSAEVSTQQFASLRSEHFRVAVEATGRMTADPLTFLVTLGLDAREETATPRALPPAGTSSSPGTGRLQLGRTAGGAWTSLRTRRW